jgi:hypothetical protein
MEESNNYEIEPRGPSPELIARGQELMKEAGAAIIDSQEKRDAATTVLKMFTELRKAREEQRVKITKPLLDSKKEIDNLFKAASADADAYEGELKKRCMAWDREQERIARERAEEERKRREAEVAERAAKMESEGRQEEAELMMEAETRMPAAAPQAPQRSYGTYGGTSSTTTLIDYKITRLQDVPDEFLNANPAKWREALDGNRIRAALKGDRKIPGIELVKKDSIRTT